jgi:RNA polymerase sigma-70 factor (ECF subfamily)
LNTLLTLRHFEDSELIDQVFHRNEAALGELYDRYHRLIFSVAINVVGSREDAEEITLDVFTRVWEKAGTYRADRAKVSTWLTRMTRNRAIDLLRREEVRPMKHSLSWAEVTIEPADMSHNPEASASLSLEAQRVRAAMSSLHENQQEVLALAYFKGYTHSEIAKLLDIPLGTAKARIRAGMRQLRALLLEE